MPSTSLADFLRSHRAVHIGTVSAASSCGAAQRLEVEVERAFPEPGWCRFRVYVPSNGLLWLDEREAADLLGFLRAAARAVRQDCPGPVGQLEWMGRPGDPPYLTVTVAPAPYLAEVPALRVCLHFDDELVRESGDDGLVWLTSTGARSLARQLAGAMTWAEAHPVLDYGS